MTPEDWLSIRLIGAPCSGRLASDSAPPPPRWEGGRGRLEAAGDDLLDDVEGELLLPAGEGEGDHDGAVLESLEVPRAVEGLQRVGRVVLERAQEGLEAEVQGVGEVPDAVEELRGVPLEHLGLVVALVDEEPQPLRDTVERHRVR